MLSLRRFFRGSSRPGLNDQNGHHINQGREAGIANWRWVESLRVDLFYAARILRKSPGFTAIAVASLALAIGANTTIFSYANQMLFVRLSVPHPERLRVFRLSGDSHMAILELAGEDAYSDNGRFHLGLFPYPAYRALRQRITLSKY
jgi:hypothetical protein